MDKQTQVYLQFLGFLRTPALWMSTEHFEYPQFLLDVREVPSDGNEVLEIPERLVLGKRIEHFFSYYLTNFSEQEILVKNIPILAGKITIGEIDFLLKDKQTGRICHVEVMYKFFIYDPEIPEELERWIGPNQRDSLCKKLRKLKAQQFPLLFRKETQPLLEKLNCNAAEFTQKVCFKAHLFVPLDLWGHSLPLINNDCIQGYWIRFADFTEAEYGDFSFYSPKKADWPVEPGLWKQWVSFSEIQAQVLNLLSEERSPLIWMKVNESEFSRFFVVWW